MPRASRRIVADPYIVDALVRGEEVHGRPNNADAREVICALAERGYTDGQIAHVLGRQRRSVMRTRNALGVPPAIPRHVGNGRYLPVDAPTRPRDLR